MWYAYVQIVVVEYYLLLQPSVQLIRSSPSENKTALWYSALKAH